MSNLPMIPSVEVQTRAEFVKSELITLSNIFHRSWLHIGRYMKEVKERQYYKQYQCRSAEEFCRTHLGLGSRQVENYMQDYALYVEQLHIPEQQLLEIGSSKLTAMAPVITKENVSEWLKYARKNTVRDVKNRKAALLGDEQLDRVEEKAGVRSTWQVGITPEVRTVLNTAIEGIKQQTGTDDMNTIMELLAANTLSSLNPDSSQGMFLCMLNPDEQQFMMQWVNRRARMRYATLGAFLVACLKRVTFPT